MYYVYLLNDPSSSAIYIGYTADLRRRFQEHQILKRHRGWRLVYYEAYLDERDARKRERKLKDYGSSLGKLKERIAPSLAGSGIERAGSQ